MFRHRKPFYLTKEEAKFLDNVLEQHLEALELVNPLVIVDPAFTDMQSLLEMTAENDREASVLQSLRERINEHYGKR